MSTHGPRPGTASLVAAQREKAQQLLLDETTWPGVQAEPGLVARLVSCKHLIGLGATTVRLRIGGEVRELGASDIDVLLGLCAEAFQRFDQA